MIAVLFYAQYRPKLMTVNIKIYNNNQTPITMSIIYAKTATFIDIYRETPYLRVVSGNVSRGDMLGYALDGKIHSLGTIKVIMHGNDECHFVVNPTMDLQHMRVIMDDGKSLHSDSIPEDVNQLMVVIPVKVKCLMNYICLQYNTVKVNDISGSLEIGDVLMTKTDVDMSYFDCLGRMNGITTASKDLEVDSSKRELCVHLVRKLHEYIPIPNVSEVVVLEPTKPSCEIFIDEDGYVQVKKGVLHVGDVLMKKPGKTGATHVVSKVLSLKIAAPYSDSIQSTDEPIKFIIEMKDGSELQKNQTYTVLE